MSAFPINGIGVSRIRTWAWLLLPFLLAALAGLWLEQVPDSGTRVPYVNFFPAVVLAALYGGFCLGMLAAFVSVALACYFWIEPMGNFAATDWADWLGLMTFFLSCTVVSCGAEAMDRARRRAVAAEEELKKAHRELEQRVRDRTEALQRANRAEHLQLQEELLTISEREKQVIAQELHDGLCQSLAGTAMMGCVLYRRLVARDDPDAGHAQEIFAMLNMAVNEARNIAHGLHPIGPQAEGLMDALAQLATTVSNLFHIGCTFECPEPVLLENEVASTHLFRITQEALNNARKHGEADNILIRLEAEGDAIVLTIRDDGCGIPDKLPKKRGLGLNTMNHRASEIGATLTVQRAGEKGTLVCCKARRDALGKLSRKPRIPSSRPC